MCKYVSGEVFVEWYVENFYMKTTSIVIISQIQKHLQYRVLSYQWHLNDHSCKKVNCTAFNLLYVHKSQSLAALVKIEPLRSRSICISSQQFVLTDSKWEKRYKHRHINKSDHIHIYDTLSPQNISFSIAHII